MAYKTFIFIYLVIYFSSGYCKSSCTVIPKKCPETKYRSFDGSCNNMKHPDWGVPLSKFRRLLPPEYGDGISSFRTAKSGKELPNAREISALIYPGTNVADLHYTLSLMQYGQVITHDIAMILSDGATQNLCCTKDLQFLNKAEMPPKCAPIPIPPNDPYYSKHGAKCLSFGRIDTDKEHGCGEDNKPIEQMLRVNSYLDLSIIYGNTKDINNYIRLNKGGLLKVRKDNGQDWPLDSINTKEDCSLSKESETCFYASDPRINQTPQLTILHIIFYREHNRLAKELSKINPHWDDDTIFEEARKINIAQHQWISYYEWLPLLLNRTVLLENKIIYDSPKTHIQDYDPNVDPTILTEHNNAAFRIHTQVAGHLDLVTEDRISNHSVRISDWYWRPKMIEEENHFTCLTRGLTTQASLGSDEYHDSEITNFWYRRGLLGYDLKSIDIQRGRDVGLPTYNKIRALCNLPTSDTFSGLKHIPKDISAKLAKLYETPDDIDLHVGGSVEELAPGALVGPTFQCILLKQFLRTRVGDRFWFERKGETGFTLEQLNEIRAKARLSKILCDNTKDLAKMQLKAFKKADSLNPLVPCDTLPALNLNLWKN